MRHGALRRQVCDGVGGLPAGEGHSDAGLGRLRSEFGSCGSGVGQHDRTAQRQECQVAPDEVQRRWGGQQCGALGVDPDFPEPHGQGLGLRLELAQAYLLAVDTDRGTPAAGEGAPAQCPRDRAAPEPAREFVTVGRRREGRIVHPPGVQCGGVDRLFLGSVCGCHDYRSASDAQATGSPAACGGEFRLFISSVRRRPEFTVERVGRCCRPMTQHIPTGGGLRCSRSSCHGSPSVPAAAARALPR